MFGIRPKHALVTAAVAAVVLAAAGPATAGTSPSGVITYNGHAGLGASVYQHNQTSAITDGTSNTVMFGARAALMADMGGQFQV
jgi:hypothetical protein